MERTKEPMTAGNICRMAADLVSGDRARQHGDKGENFAKTARLWQAYLDTRRDPKAPLSAVDVANLMVMHKLARTQSGSFNPDDFVDIAGYAGCGGEIAAEENKEPRFWVVDGDPDGLRNAAITPAE